MTSRTEELCSWLAELDYCAIPPRVLDRAKDLVLDHLGVSLYASQKPWSAMVRENALAQVGGSTVYGYGTASPRDAALANATAGHGIELDDTHDESMSHPGAVVIPAALALAEGRQCDGRGMITAIVAGYEAQCRVGAAATDALFASGFHPTATTGAFGATAAAGQLFALSAAQLQSAFGLVLSMVSGTIQFTEDPAGTMVKRLHAGIPARNGLLAAQLAQRGMQGPHSAVDGRYGFLRLFAHHETDTDRLVAGLGQRWEMDSISIKLYSCCRLFHSFVDAIGTAQVDSTWKPEDVDTVTVLGPRAMFEGRTQTRPASVMAAQYSMPYVAAATLLLDPRDPGSFSETAMGREDLRSMINRIRWEPRTELDHYFPARCPGGVRILLKDGRSVEHTVIDSIGTPVHPVDRDGICDKFRLLTSGVLTPSRRDRIIDAVYRLDSVGGIAALMSSLRFAITGPGQGATA